MDLALEMADIVKRVWRSFVVRPPPIVPKLAEEDREGSPGVPGEGKKAGER